MSIPNSQPVIDIPKINSRGKKSKEFSGRESESDDKRSQNSSRQPGTKAPRAQNLKGNGNVNQGQEYVKSGHLVNDIQRSPFARTQPSPELTDNYNDGRSQGRTNRAPESAKNQAVNY